MIAAIEGKIYDFTNEKVFIYTKSGLVYELNATIKLIDQVSDWNNEEPILIPTQTLYREDSQLLFGFANLKEKELFNLLLQVSGIGGSYAHSIINQIESTREFYQAIADGDTQYLVKLHGVGLNKAKAIIKHLKKKVSKIIE